MILNKIEFKLNNVLKFKKLHRVNSLKDTQ